MNHIYKQGFIIPAIASLLLFAGFIGYFLSSEYEKEKEAIILESRDSVFVKILTNIRGAGPVEWVKDSLGNEGLIQLTRKIDPDFRKREIFQFDSVNLNTESKVLYHLEVNYKDSLTTDDSLDSGALPKALEIFTSPNSPFDFSDSSKFSLQRHEIHGSFDSSPFAIQEHKIEVPAIDVWKRLIPQILFSLLLFGSVIVAYYMIAKSLKKERQLSLLRNEFMSNMSHELKTPVSTISVALEALSSFNAADNINLRKEYIDISRAEVDRLGLLVDKALNISLFEQGKFIYDKQQLDLKSEIEHVLKILKVQLDNQQVELAYDFKGTNFNIFGDRTHMVNVVHNLIENAIKYANKHPEIQINLREHPEVIELAVSDNGMGIPPAFQDKVFDKFFRVPQGDTHNIKGHGLGLSYVKQVITNHGGEIKVKSGEGIGTTFILTFPKSDSSSNNPILHD